MAPVIEWFANGRLANGKPSECAGCPYVTEGQGFVPGEGPLDAAIMLVGEYAGEDEVVPQYCLTCEQSYEWWLEARISEGADALSEGCSPRTWRALHTGHTLVGRPFVGRSGRFLTRLLERAGIRRDQVYVTNIVKCRPPMGQEPSDEAVACCTKYHVREVEAIQPNVVATIGNTALEWYTGHREIRKYRGSVEPTDPARTHGVLKVLPILQPAGIMRSVGREGANANLMISLTIADFRKLHALAKRRDWDFGREDFLIEPSLAELEAYVASTGELGYMVDIETPYDTDVFSCSILCVGFYCYSTGRAISVPFHTPQGDYWPSLDEELRAIELVQAMLSRPCDFHNATFDVTVLESVGWRVTLRDCTLVMDWQLNPENYHALHEVMKRHTYLPYHKDEGKGDPQLLQLPNHRFWSYNCKDVRGQALSKASLVDDLAAERNYSEVFGRAVSLLDYYTTITRPLLRHTINMAKRGMYIDESARQSYLADVEAKKAELQRLVDDQTGIPNFNPRSSTDLERALIERLRLPVVKLTKGGRSGIKRPSFDEDALLQYKLLGPPEVMDAILELRGLLNLESSFLHPRIYPDGRVRVQWAIHRTVTGRFASSPNFQNIIMTDGGRARGMYRAQPGNRLIHADHSQVEFRIFSFLAPDEEWEAQFEEYDRRTELVRAWRRSRVWTSELLEAKRRLAQFLDTFVQAQEPDKQAKLRQDPDSTLLQMWVREVDVHTNNGAVMKQKPWYAVTYDERFRGKIFIYGFLYGGSVEGILERGGRGLSRGTDQLDVLAQMTQNLMQRHPSLLRFRERITQQLLRYRKLVNPWGFVRFFFGDSRNIKREGWCSMNQMSAASLINQEFARIGDRVLELLDHDPTWGFVNQVHDMMLIEAPSEVASEIAQIMHEEMHRPVTIGGKVRILPASVSVGDRWSDFA